MDSSLKKLGKYVILRTINAKDNCKVKLGIDTESG